MSEADLIQLRFGEYQVIAELGRGATSTVFLAEKKFGRFETAAEGAPAGADSEFPSLDEAALDGTQKPSRAAVKVVSFTDETSKLSRRFRKLFATEAWVASQLDHPNITKVFGWKVEDERAYLILEHLEGKTLDEYITMDKLLPVQQVVDIIHKVAVALDYAHRKGVVNRDVKPANVMLCENGDIKLMDFGLALNTNKNVNIDSTYINGLGSPSYMSPEQIKGYTLNHQTDLYSLGVMFYQLLTGRLPFRAKNTASLVYKIVNTDAVPVNQLNPELPEFTHKVIARAMEKDLYSRYRQGAQLAKDLSDAPYQRVKQSSSVNLDVRWKAVRALPLLGGLDDMDVWELLRASNWREYPPAKVIVREGEVDKSFGLVIEGHVEIENGATSMTIASRGDFLGIAEWLDSAVDARRSSSATTLDKVVYLEINPAAFAYATEELSEEIHRLATDALIKRMRGAMRIAKQLCPPAIHPAPEVPDAGEEEAVAGRIPGQPDAGTLGATAENPIGWGAFARVGATAATATAVGLAVSAGRGALSPAASVSSTAVPSVPRVPPSASQPVPEVLVPAPPASVAAPALPAEPDIELPTPVASEPTRKMSVVVQPLSAAAAAAITQSALGGASGQNAAGAASQAFDLGPASSHPDFVPLLFDDDHTVPNPPAIKRVDELPDGAVLTTEMGANFNATTAYATSDMAANFMSTTSLDNAIGEESAHEPGELMPSFDVHQRDTDAVTGNSGLILGGSSTSEMAPNFAGTTAFRADQFSIPAAPPDQDQDEESSAMLTSEMAPDFAGTTAFSYSDAPLPMPLRPVVARGLAARGPSSAGAEALADADDADMKTQEMAPDFAATTAFMSHDAPPPLPPRNVPEPELPVFDAEKTTIMPHGFAAAAAARLDLEKTIILKGGFDSTVNAASSGVARFTEELFPAIDAAPPGNFIAPRKTIKDVPPEDFDKTVEISGGFESQPGEDEEPLDDLFPPIKF